MLSTQPSAEPLPVTVSCADVPATGESLMTDLVNPQPSPDWRQAIQAAKREDDPEKLAPLLKAAEDAIFTRFQELNGKRSTERNAIRRAVAILRELQVKKLNFPSWESENKGEPEFLPRRHFL